MDINNMLQNQVHTFYYLNITLLAVITDKHNTTSLCAYRICCT